MLLDAFILLSMAAGGTAYQLAEPVVYRSARRATYQGGWGLFVSNACPKDNPVMCGTDTDNVAKICCPSGNTCFGGYAVYCCPTSA
jgi:hypothetical protein